MSPRRLILCYGIPAGLVLAAICTALGIRWYERGPGFAAQAERIVALGGLSGGAAVAELGAGDGRLSLLVANRLGPRSRILLTEVSEPQLEVLRRKTAHFPNFEIRRAGGDSTNLPAACCSLIYFRRVYHHFDNPAAMSRSLYQSLQPGGRLIVIDFVTPSYKLWNRQSWSRHGIEPPDVIRQLVSAGFTLEQQIRSWVWLDYWLVFRKPAGSGDPPPGLQVTLPPPGSDKRRSGRPRTPIG